MIKRYSDDIVTNIFSRENRLKIFLNIQKELVIFLSEIKRKDVEEDFKSIDMEKLSKLAFEIEENTQHETASFVDALEEILDKKYSSYIHRGLTSSDVLDTTLSIQIYEACKYVAKLIEKLEDSLYLFSNRNSNVLMLGKTHGQPAEPVLLSHIVDNYIAMCERASNRIQEVLDNIPVKLSGPVGNYSNISSEFEYYFNINCLDDLKYGECHTQVISRDYHSDLIYALSTIGTILEKISVDIRLRSMSGVDEFKESFSKSQKGSSAMPHKKNPILSENITGISRLLRSYVAPAIENITLWDQRDMSHSSVERVIIEDSFTLACFGLNRMSFVIDNLYVNKKKIEENIAKDTNIFSHTLLVELMKKGFVRSEAYKKVQEMSNNITIDSIRQLNIFDENEIKEILDLQKFMKRSREY